MDIAKKLRQVVTANFIEIVKSDERERPKQNAPSLPTMDSLPPLSARVPSDNSAQVQELAETNAQPEPEQFLNSQDTEVNDEPIFAESIQAPDEEPVTIEAESDIVEPAEFRETVTDMGDETLEDAIAEVIEPETAAVPEPVPAFDPMVFVNTDSTLDFARLLKSANLPPVPFTAEQALKIISALPDDLPMRVKRSTVKATLEAINPEIAEDARDILADAMLKRVHVGQLRDALVELVDTDLRIRQEELAHVRAEMARLEGEVAEFERRQTLYVESCNNYINQFQQVVLYLQPEETASPVAAEPTDEEELPPFMREDTVFRLLGMNGSENASELTDEPVRNGKAVAKGRRH